VTGWAMRRIADYELIESLGTGNHGEYFVARPRHASVSTWTGWR
jgi:hypothetical protein